MKKFFACFALVMAIASIALAGHTFLDWPANGVYQSGLGPVQIVAVDVIGSAVTNGTVILKRITSDGSSTNALAFGTLTCVGGALQKAITNEVWLFQDDSIQRSGTATNARVRVILYQ